MISYIFMVLNTIPMLLTLNPTLLAQISLLNSRFLCQTNPWLAHLGITKGVSIIMHSSQIPGVLTQPLPFPPPAMSFHLSKWLLCLSKPQTYIHPHFSLPSILCICFKSKYIQNSAASHHLHLGLSALANNFIRHIYTQNLHFPYGLLRSYHQWSPLH